MNPSTIFEENIHDHTITLSKINKQINHTTHIFFLGKACCSKPLYLYCIMNQGIMKQYNACVLTTTSYTLPIVSH